MLVFLVQKPQVLQADMALVMESNQPIPVSFKETNVTNVRAMYVRNIRLAKLLVRPPAKESRATLEISAPDKVDLSALVVIIEKSVTIPTPPTQAVEMRQN